MAQGFPLWKVTMQIFAILTTLDALLWISVYTETGAIPFVSTITVGWWWQWELPFSVSRLFDVLMGPLCMALFTWACRYDCFYADLSEIAGHSFGGHDVPSKYTSLFGRFFSFVLVFGLLYSMVYGAPSFPIGLVVFTVLSPIAFAVLVVVLVIKEWGT